MALLAQTCSAIGADAPNPKLVANVEKNAKNFSKSDNRDKSSPGSQSSLSNCSNESQQKSSFKPYESTLYKERVTISTPDEHRSSSVSNRIKTPKSSYQNQSQTNGRCDSNQSASSLRASPAAFNNRKLEKSGSPTNRASNSKDSPSVHTSLESRPHYSSPKSIDVPTDVPISYPKTSSAAMPMTSTASPFFSSYGAPGLPYPMDIMTASALMSPHHAMLKASTMNPYLNYASRIKLPGGNAESMMTGCRDPFCTGCSLTPHPVGKCQTGCTQCDHSTSKTSYAHQMAAATYAHAQLAALAAASQMPYVCNWIAGDAAYCGKRFGTSDELLQHLRTHTSSMPESMLNSATAGLPPTHPLFQRTYPTPPLSPLSSSRYHPYSKPSLIPPTMSPSLTGLPIPHPSLAQYFSPYLYGPRLGASPGMHP